MSEFKGTKGEWFTDESYDFKYKQKTFKIGTDSDDEFVTVWTGLNEQQAKANAKLISCAPEMLNKLIECVEGMKILQLSNKNHKGLARDIKEAKELIKKATS